MKEYELKRSNWKYKTLDWLNVTPSNSLCLLHGQVMCCFLLVIAISFSILWAVSIIVAMAVAPFLYLYFNMTNEWVETFFVLGTILYFVGAIGYAGFLWKKYVSFEDSDNIFIAKARATKQQICPRVRIVD